MALTTETARTLAITYQAFNEKLYLACSGTPTPSEIESLKLWGRLLTETQIETGVTMIDVDSIKRLISLAEDRARVAA